MFSMPMDLDNITLTLHLYISCYVNLLYDISSRVEIKSLVKSSQNVKSKKQHVNTLGHGFHKEGYFKARRFLTYVAHK